MLEYVLLLIVVLLLIYNFNISGILIGSLLVLFVASPEQKGITGGASQLTYALDAVFIPDKYLDILKDWKRVPLNTKPKYVDVVLCLSGGSHYLYNTKAKLKSRTDSLEITDKVNFHHHMEKINPKAIAKTMELTPDSVITSGVWMIRANWGWKGRASGIATSTEQLQELRQRFSTLPRDWKKPTKPRVIASEYIMDPLLWKGFKFHVRVHVFAVVLSDRRYAVMLPSVEIIAAGKPFVNANYDDDDIHDTHDERNVLNGWMPQDIDNGDELYGNIITVLKESIPPLLPLLKLYPEAENSYDLFGVDIMFRTDGSPVILEINSTPGVTTLTGEPVERVVDEITNAIFVTAFSDLFFPAGDKTKIIPLCGRNP